MKVLGIETSCDETAASVVEDGRLLVSNVVASSMALHAKYGGVIPEIAARSHIESIIPVISDALDSAQCSWKDIDAIAVTNGAGLGGSLLVGVLTAATLAIGYNKPLYPINHVIGHVYAGFMTDSNLKDYVMPISLPEFPLLAIIVSGGHSQLAIFYNHLDYSLLGRTRDDAIGEAFDKVAKILGLPYPGGPNIAKLALKGDVKSYRIPEAKLDSLYDFSFSGPKTAVLRLAQSEIGENFNFPSFELSKRLSEAQKANIAASFQYSAIKTIVTKALVAYQHYLPKSVVIAGGVAANQELRRQLLEVIPSSKLIFPDIKLCTDNGAMIATRGFYEIKSNRSPVDPYSIDVFSNLKM